MADNKLNVEIGATTKELEKGLAKAIKELDKLKDEQRELNKAIAKGGKDVDKYYSKLAKNSTKLAAAGKAVKGYKTQIASLGKSNTALGVKTANATPALQEFSRVIQDAPYGIQGVANNITQLTSQFGYLSKSAGGTKQALSAMLSTMAGPAGILFAVSAVTSLLVTYGDELEFAASDAEKLAEAQAEFVAEAQAEIRVLNQLIRIAQDESNSKKERQGAIDEINKKYSKYLGNLDFEKIKTDEVKTSVDALSKSLILNAKLKGVSALIDERNAENTNKIILLQETQIKTEKKLAELEKKTGREDVKRRQGTRRALERIKKEIAELEAEAGDATKTLIELEEALRKAVAGGTPTQGNPQNPQNPQDSPRYVAPALESFLKPTKGTLFSGVIEDIKEDTPKMKDALDGINNELIDFSAQASAIVSSGISNTFAGIGSAIGEALVTGANVMEAAGGALLSGIGQIAVELGKAAIAIGVGMISIQGAFSNPASAIAAGVALVAIGSAISAAAQITSGGGSDSVGSVAGGGRESSGYSASSRGGGGSNAGGTYVFEIAGTKLVGVLQNTLERNRSLGGTNKLTFSS